MSNATPVPGETGSPDESREVQAGCMPPWKVGELPRPPRISWSPRALVGPGLMMAGAAIGGGEWLMGPAVTAQYGGVVMWIAMVSILFQVVYNLEIMRYTVYCGEPIIVGFFRIAPGPRFWTIVYLAVDFFGIWPYLAANAAVPFHAAILGHLPGAAPTQYLSDEQIAMDFGLPLEQVRELRSDAASYGTKAGQKPYPAPIAARVESEMATKGRIAYGIFLLSFVPLIFGGKIYNSLERLMVAKIIVVLGYLLFLGFFYVSWSTWLEVFAGLVFLGKGSDGSWAFRLFPDWATSANIDWSLLAAFAAIAGQGGMTNSQLSTYTRDKGWGMGALVGAIPSMVGGKGISLSHTGKVFPITPGALERWKGWLKVLWRDQWVIWAIGCILGVTIPALVSLEFVRGLKIRDDAIAAATAQGIVDRTGNMLFWFLTLFCGFIVLFPSQISQVDGIVRRWTDVLWTGSRRLKSWKGDRVKYVYYSLLAAYGVWGFGVLTLLPNPLLLTKFTGAFMNFALGFSAFHTIVVNRTLLPRALQAGHFTRVALLGCGIFFITLGVLGLRRALVDVGLL